MSPATVRELGLVASSGRVPPNVARRTSTLSTGLAACAATRLGW